MSFETFHPAVRAWFEGRFAAPTEVQQRAWAAISAGQHCLLAAPTGSGKTLAAFLATLNELVEEGVSGALGQHTRVLYISPLKALSSDVQKNLQTPLAGIRTELQRLGTPDVAIQAWVRTGDTPQQERAKARRSPPHILVTTPESLYILLTSDSGRDMLATVRTVIVDEIHALAGNKRGAHLMLSLERLQALCSVPLRRIGLSATQKPIEQMARFLLGQRDEPLCIVDTGHRRDRDLALELPRSPLDTIMSNDIWQEVYDRLATLAQGHTTTLVFVNTRRLAERAARFLAERLGEEQVTAHHGSLSREHRQRAEQRLKAGELRCLVATASLELGIDIGDIDLVCQLGSPGSISAFLQRVGRSGHAIGKTPKGRLFPLSRDDLVECTALLAAVNDGELEQVRLLPQPLDVLAQSLVAELGCREWLIDALYQMVCRAWPYRTLARATFDTLLRMLAEGFSTRRGRHAAHIHLDAVNQRVLGRRGARLLALTNGGAIPDLFDYEVILSPQGLRVGSLNEDFSFESLPGDIFQLGNTSYRILKIEQGKVFVEDAHGEPPNIPFWFGEAPGRSDELTLAVSQLRERVDEWLGSGLAHARDQLLQHYPLDAVSAESLLGYLAAARAALGVIPSRRQIVLERFFDGNGDMHLVIHSAYGSRLNRAWGLGLRKRFCRKFNFELQAAALEDSIVLSLSSSHSFPLEEVRSYLHSQTVRHIVIQALLDAPMFATHWRWNATIALAVARFRGGRRNPPQFQRSDAEDLVAVVFPDQLACFENLAGEREVPDHPLVQQTLDDCLHRVMDIDGLEALLQAIEADQVVVTGRDLSAPSVLSAAVLNARPYAFLDDAPAEERRTLAVQGRSSLVLEDAAALGQIKAEALQRLLDEIHPQPRDADELHDLLLLFGFLTEDEIRQSATLPAWLTTLAAQQRATRASVPGGAALWVAAERLAQLQQLLPGLSLQPPIPVPCGYHSELDGPQSALTELLRSRLEGLGPVTIDRLSAPLAVEPASTELALLALEQEGFVVRGHFGEAGDGGLQWCERRLLARLHRYSVSQRRGEVRAVSAAAFMRFLLQWQGLDEPQSGIDATLAVIEQLEGFALAAQAWESAVLPARIADFFPDVLDNLCLAGRVGWMRLQVGASEGRKTGPVRHSPIALLQRHNQPLWRYLLPLPAADERQLGANAERVLAQLQQQGAAFFSDLVRDSGLLPTQVEDALGELVNQGLVSADSFAGLRALITPAAKRPGRSSRRGRALPMSPFDRAGRWSLTAAAAAEPQADEALELCAWSLLQRYGVVFRSLLERETALPPWRDLLRYYWRLEARGEIRGGRFVDGVAGEQFALPEVLPLLRRQRESDSPLQLQLQWISACDPLNLQGILLPGEKVAAVPGNRLVLRHGEVLAVDRNGELQFQQPVDADTEAAVARLLVAGKKKATLGSRPDNRLRRMAGD